MNDKKKSDAPSIQSSLRQVHRRRRMVLWSITGIAVAAAIAAVAAGPIMSRVERPRYDVIERAGAIEVRAYAPMIAAQTSVLGERKPAIEEGFRRIASYIFGANKPRTKIAMTAPVTQAPSQKIAMTAPVTQQAQGKHQWTISFIMPSAYTLQALPEPDDARIDLIEIPARKMLAITFSGTASDTLIGGKISELRDYAKSKGLKVSDEPTLAFYNPPWTLPFLRRNEVLFLLGP